jgi:hypothetical protein
MSYLEDPIKPLQKYIDLYEKYKASKENIQDYKKDFNEENGRLAIAIASAIIGGIESRAKDEEVRRWAIWGVKETMKTFNSFPRLSENQLSYLFFVLGRHFVPVLLHEKGIKSDSFKALPEEEQLKAVMDVLDINFENVVIRCLQAIDFLHIE